MALITKHNWRQNNVHTAERSWTIIHRGLEAWNKCPYVIDYTLQANEINRAWIDSVESCQWDARSRVQRLYWHAHIQRASERDQSVLLAANGAVSFFTAWIRSPSPSLPTRQSGSVLLKSNARNRIWQAGEQPLSHRCWENLSFVKDKQQPGCEGRDLPSETRAAGSGSNEGNRVEPSMHCFIISPGASDQRNNLLKLPEEWQREETVTSYCPSMSAGWVWQQGQG